MSDALMPSDGVTVEEVAEEAAGKATSEAASEAADEATSGGRSADGFLKALLHTEPEISPEAAKRDLGVGEAGAQGWVGMRKFAAGLGVGDGEEGGTPAVVHFGMAGWLWFTGADEEPASGGDDDGGDEAGAGAGDEEAARSVDVDPELLDDPASGGRAGA